MNKIAEKAWDEFLESLGKTEAPKIKFKIADLFDTQEPLDVVKRKISKDEVNALLKLYLSQIDIMTLGDKIKSHPINFERGFGRDRLNHLKLIVSLLTMDEERKPVRGLLAC